MAITTEIENININVTEPHKVIQIEKATIIKEDGIELTRTPQWAYYAPSIKNGDTWEDTDVSSENSEIQSLCTTLWTDSVKTAYQNHQDSLHSLDNESTP